MEFQCCAKQSAWCQGYHNEYDRHVSSSYGVCNTLERNTIKRIHEKFTNIIREVGFGHRTLEESSLKEMDSLEEVSMLKQKNEG